MSELYELCNILEWIEGKEALNAITRVLIEFSPGIEKIGKSLHVKSRRRLLLQSQLLPPDIKRYPKLVSCLAEGVTWSSRRMLT